ncbi:hypothetical protein ABPG77_001021 [Micractinium sp. CCAP 211/92]
MTVTVALAAWLGPARAAARRVPVWLAGTRSLASSAAKPALESSTPDLNALWEQHIATEFTEKSAAAAVATMVPSSTVNHVPVMTGGVGTQALEQFYAEHFIPKMPPDVKLTPIDRHIAPPASLIDEFVFEFTHSQPMDWMLPGVASTGRRVKVPFVVVVKFEGDKLSAERIYWDQASVLVQLGLLDPAGLPVVGPEQADKVVAVAGGQAASGPPSNGLVHAVAERADQPAV